MKPAVRKTSGGKKTVIQIKANVSGFPLKELAPADTDTFQAQILFLETLMTMCSTRMATNDPPQLHLALWAIIVSYFVFMVHKFCVLFQLCKLVKLISRGGWLLFSAIKQ